MSSSLKKIKRASRLPMVNPQLMRMFDQTLAERPCGECKACCTVMGVPEFEKPVDTPCKHLCVTGCGIYEARPVSCQQFECAWRLGIGTLDQRPDKLGLVLFPLSPKANLGHAFVAREVYPGAFDDAAAFLVETAQRMVILLVRGERVRRVLGPPDRVERLKPALKRLKEEQDGRLDVFG